MKKLVFLGACLVALASSPVKAQTGGADVVVVRTKELVGISSMVVVRPTGDPEEVDFPSNLTKAAKTLQQVVTKLYQEGYSLKNTYSAPATGTSTLIFVREKEK